MVEGDEDGIQQSLAQRSRNWQVRQFRERWTIATPLDIPWKRSTDQIADAVVRRLVPTLAQQLTRHQERLQRTRLTPPQGARLAGCRDQTVYAALSDGRLPGCFNANGNGGRGTWHILRSDFEIWVVGLHRQRS